ncbi:hypothetical protein GF339_01150 [candidate division KSB3 bacterium]|uniref:Cytochrome P460 domain-containing protein n=1 Tax=candidate division KSB3 bacterium TaxID=2044937 RepID=A0A9D5Q4G3_9BACT|nr:hypothetical protein [candidate division KSB3 bacterium]MBD3323157.1 hypothetical protein [candidate division KSB3 bacterium]
MCSQISNGSKQNKPDPPAFLPFIIETMRANVLQHIVVWLMGGMMILGCVGCQKQEEVPAIPAEYRDWTITNDIALDYPIPGHEDNCRVIYINPTGEQVQPTEHQGRVVYDYPEGTIIVKEVYEGLEEPEEGEEPMSLTVMIKAPQHPQSRAGWLWIVTSSASGQQQIIERDFCVDCHANANESHPYADKNVSNEFRDYVYFPPR